MANIFRMQLSVIFHRKSAICMYLLMCALVVLNFITNVKMYAGCNVWNMYHPMRLVLLSDYSALAYDVIQYYPFLVVFPAAFTFFNDKNCRENIIMEAKTNRRVYYAGTMLAIFVVTFLVFVIPMLMELLINCVAFPTEALGDQSNIGLFENQSMIESYFLSDLWIFQPYLYTICMIGIFGVTSGVLACFASACSLIGKQKFKVLLLVPVYALLYVVMMLEKILGLEFDTNYFFYLKFFAGGSVNESVFFVFLGVIALFTVAILVLKMRKDELG